MLDSIFDVITMGQGERGCSLKVDGGLYCCVGLGEGGSPIENFVIDEARPWEGGHFQGGILVERKDASGEPIIDFAGRRVKDLVMWIGEENYLAAADYIEEVRRMGLSKRLPSNFPVDQLNPGMSRIILIHPNAIPQFDYSATYPFDNPAKGGNEERAYSPLCRRENLYRYGQRSEQGGEVCEHPVEDHRCTFDLWVLGAYQESKKHEVEAEDGGFKITTPSGSYRVPDAIKLGEGVDPKSLKFKSGAVLALHMTHFEFCSEKADPTEVREKVKGAGFPFRTVDTEGRPNGR